MMLQIFFNISSDIYYHHLYRPFATNTLNESNPLEFFGTSDINHVPR